MDFRKQAWKYILTNGYYKKKPVDIGQWIAYVIACIAIIGLLYLFNK